LGTEEKQLLENTIYSSNKLVTSMVSTLIPLEAKVDVNDPQACTDWIYSGFSTWEKKEKEQSLKFSFMDPSIVYNPQSGISIAIDTIHNCPGQNLAIAFATVVVPGQDYSSAMRSTSLFCKQWQWNSYGQAPKFTDGFRTIKGMPFHKRAVLVIELRMLIPSARGSPAAANDSGCDMKTFGWMAIPIFKSDDQVDEMFFVNEGSFQLPLFDGFPSSPVLEALLEAKNHREVWSDSKWNKTLFPMAATSVFVRICDAQKLTYAIRKYPKVFDSDTKNINKMYLPTRSLSQYRFNKPSPSAEFGAPKTLAQLIPNGLKPPEFGRMLIAQIAQETGITAT
jgi:hypothetical protein